MENAPQKKLPNANTALVLGIISYIACCITGIGGVLFSVIALVLTRKDSKTYAQSPDEYYNFSQVKTAKIIAIIGLILSLIVTALLISAIIGAGSFGTFIKEMQEAYESGYNQWE